MDWVRSDHVVTPTHMNATTEELFSERSFPRGYKWDKYRVYFSG
jgi:hypothetical protein